MPARTLPARLARAVAVVGWACAAWLGARPCVAASCPVEVRGAPSEPWLRATRAIEALATDSGDCAHIELEPRADAARLIFVTRDGRRAERNLGHPDELLPTVVALGIRGASETSTPAPEDSPARVADAASLLDSPHWQPGAAPPEARAHFALLGGTRAGAGLLLSPVLGASAAVALERWELGIALVLELQYVDLHGGVPNAPSSAASFGVTVGRREPIAEFDLLFGARAMVAALNDESKKDSGERGRAELRLGAYLGGVWPRQQSPRFRADLALDVVPHDVLGSLGTPVTPWLALSVLFGVELGGP